MLACHQFTKPSACDLRGLRRESCDNTRAITNILQSDIVVGVIVLLALLAILFVLARATRNHNHALWVGFLDVPEPAAQAGHQVLLDICVCHTVAAQCAPDGRVGVGEAIAYNMAAECEVGIEFGEMGLDSFEVERLEILGALLPLGDLGLHVV